LRSDPIWLLLLSRLSFAMRDSDAEFNSHGHLCGSRAIHLAQAVPSIHEWPLSGSFLRAG
jgi:hypothetical protein